MAPEGPLNSLANRFDAFLIDLDGVVYVGTEAVPGAARALERLRLLNKGIAFVTNDPFDSRENYVRRLAQHGIEATVEEVFTSSLATAAEVARRHGAGALVYAVGSVALRDELTSLGLNCLGAAEADRAEVVVLGWDPDFSFTELRHATRVVRNCAILYATNPDPVFPMPDGPWPATGALLAALETATGVKGVVIGKPEPYLFQLAGNRFQGRVAVIGDRVDTDIVGGRRAGFATILVTRDETSSPPGAEVAADHVIKSVEAVVE
jgi:glycerol-1-phosphatase